MIVRRGYEVPVRCCACGVAAEVRDARDPYGELPLCAVCDKMRQRTPCELLGGTPGEALTPKLVALIAERDAIRAQLAAKDDVERIALALFASDERARLFARQQSDCLGNIEFLCHPGFWRSMFVAWCRDEMRWRSDARQRAQRMGNGWSR